MSETKFISPLLAHIAIEYGIQKALREAPDYFDKFPSTPIIGVEKSKDEWTAFTTKIIEIYGPQLKEDLAEFLGVPLPDIDGDLYNPINPPDPDPEEPDEPNTGSNVIRVTNTGKKMWWNGYQYDMFVFNRMGPEYTDEPFDLVFADGKKLFVPDPKRMTMTPQNMKYQPGGQYSNNNPDIPTMQVYAWKDTHPEWVEARFRHPVEDSNSPPPTPEPEPDGGWEIIQWGGDTSLGYGGHDSRDRTWWTKIHGDHSTPWSRKFPLPRSVENARSIDFKFSDGTSLHVPNPRKMAMNHNGPKYRPEEPGEGDPRKQHPKVGAVPKSPVTWVKYRTN